MLRKEDCALGMEQRSSTKDAAARDVQTLLRKMECARSMGQSTNDQFAEVRDVQTKFNEEECAEGTGHIELTMITLLRLIHTTRLTQLDPYQIRVLLELPQEKGKREIAFQERCPSFIQKLSKSDSA